jgi:hypothetical protein
MRALAACKKDRPALRELRSARNLMKDLEFRIIPKQGRRWMPPAGNRAARHALRNMATFYLNVRQNGRFLPEGEGTICRVIIL